MKVTVIQIILGALRKILKTLENKLDKLVFKGRIETVQTREFLKSVRILRRVLEDLLSTRLQ